MIESQSETITKLKEELKSKDEKIRIEAIKALYNLKIPNLIELLPPLIEKDNSSEVRYWARRTYYLIKYLFPENPLEQYPPISEGISIDDFEKLLFDPDERIRKEALKFIKKLDSQTIAPILHKALQTEIKPEIKYQILENFLIFGKREDIPYVAKFLNHIDSKFQILAIKIIEKIKELDGFEYIIPMFQYPDPEVRQCAIKAINNLEPKELLKVLTKMLLSNSDDSKLSAINLLASTNSLAAARILAYVVFNEANEQIKQRASQALEALARSNQNIKKFYDEIFRENDTEDLQLPAIINIQTGELVSQKIYNLNLEININSELENSKKYIILTNITRKIIKDICYGDEYTKENSLKQISDKISENLVPFLLKRLEKETNPRILSFILSLLGKSKSQTAYSSVVKMFKHKDGRVRANAIEASMSIDPITTPQRIIAFLKDNNNRVKANAIIACSKIPSFNPTVFVQELAYSTNVSDRRSALYVIEKLQKQGFIEILANLVRDDDMEIRHKAFKIAKIYSSLNIKGAKELVESVQSILLRELGDEKAQDEFLKSVQTSRTTKQARKIPLTSKPKSITQEFSEQLLGKDGLKDAERKIKDLANKTIQTKDNVLKSLSNFSFSNFLKTYILHLVVLLAAITNGYYAYYSLSKQPIIRAVILFITLISYTSSIILFLLNYKLVIACIQISTFVIFTGALFYTPINSFFSPSSDIHSNLINNNNFSSQYSESEIKQNQNNKIDSTKNIISKNDSIQHLKLSKSLQSIIEDQSNPTDLQLKLENKTNVKEFEILSPQNNEKVDKNFYIKCKLAGKIKAVEVIFDNTLIARYDEDKEGIYEHYVVLTSDIKPGKKNIKIRVIDNNDQIIEKKVAIYVLKPLPQINIIIPNNKSIYWKDENFLVSLISEELEQLDFIINGKNYYSFTSINEAGVYELPMTLDTIGEGEHRLDVVAHFKDGRIATETTFFKAERPKPSISILHPPNGSKIYGKTNIKLEVDSGYKDLKITHLELYLDDEMIQNIATTTLEYEIDTSTLTQGTHIIRAKVYNEAGNYAEAKSVVEVIQPEFKVILQGISNNQLITESKVFKIQVINEHKNTTISKTTIKLDNVIVETQNNHISEYKLELHKIPTGKRKLTVELERSDGQKAKSSVVIDIKPKNVANVYLLATSNEKEFLSADELMNLGLELYCNNTLINDFFIEDITKHGIPIALLFEASNKLIMPRSKLETYTKALSYFCDILSEKHKISLVSFSDTPKILIDNTTDKQILIQELEYLKVSGGANLQNAIELITDISNKDSDKLLTVVFLDTSADINQPIPLFSNTNYIVNKINVSNSEYYFITLSNQINDQNIIYKDLEEIAKLTNSRIMNLSYNNLTDKLAKLANQINKTIKLRFEIPSKLLTPNKKYNISIVPKNPGIKLRYKNSIYFP